MLPPVVLTAHQGQGFVVWYRHGWFDFIFILLKKDGTLHLESEPQTNTPDSSQNQLNTRPLVLTRAGRSLLRHFRVSTSSSLRSIPAVPGSSPGDSPPPSTSSQAGGSPDSKTGGSPDSKTSRSPDSKTSESPDSKTSRSLDSQIVCKIHRIRKWKPGGDGSTEQGRGWKQTNQENYNQETETRLEISKEWISFDRKPCPLIELGPIHWNLFLPNWSVLFIFLQLFQKSDKVDMCVRLKWSIQSINCLWCYNCKDNAALYIFLFYMSNLSVDKFIDLNDWIWHAFLWYAWLNMTCFDVICLIEHDMLFCDVLDWTWHALLWYAWLNMTCFTVICLIEHDMLFCDMLDWTWHALLWYAWLNMTCFTEMLDWTWHALLWYVWLNMTCFIVICLIEHDMLWCDMLDWTWHALMWYAWLNMTCFNVICLIEHDMPYCDMLDWTWHALMWYAWLNMTCFIVICLVEHDMLYCDML